MLNEMQSILNKWSGFFIRMFGAFKESRLAMVLFLVLILQPAASWSQALPHHDLIFFTLQKPSGNQNWKLAAPRFLTGFNKKGYNNQPAFITEQEVYLTVQKYPDTTQTDVYALNLLLGKLTKIIQTPGLSEYSPTLMPDGKHFSAVRVEADGGQWLWRFPLDRSNSGQVIFPNINNIGYHCWLSDTLLALFQVGEPHVLTLAGLSGSRPLRIASNVGRCLQRTSGGQLLFVQKATEQTWFIKQYNPKAGNSEIVTKTLDQSEDFTLLPDGTLLAGKGSKIYQFKPGVNLDWVEIADLTKYGVNKTTRLAQLDGRKLIVVVE
jgi:hypothetical protein